MALYSTCCLLLSAVMLVQLVKQGSSCDGFSDGTACACPGSSVEYLCTVSDPSGISSTRWNGTAFQCPGNQVALLHHQYDDSGGAQDTCNDGSIMAQGLANVTGNCYTSLLTVNQIEPELNGRTVVCLTSGRIIGGTTIRIAVTLPAPSSPEVVKPNDGTRAFTVSWAPPTAECGNAVTYMYPGLAASMCGQCTGRSDTPSVTCRGWTAQGQSCSITARADNCGGQQGEQSQPVVITLETPPAPVVEGTPVYDAAGVLRKVNLQWTPVATPVDIAVSGGSVLVDGSVQNYTVLSETDDITVDLECNDTQCHSTVLLFNGTDPASLSVAAVNLLGTGDAMTVGPYERRVATIQGIDVSISGGRVAQLTVQCPPELNCASFEFGACNSSVSFEAEMETPGVFTTTQLNSTTLYCYRLYINTGVIGITEGTFATEIYPCSSVDLVPEGDSLQRSEDCTTPAEEGLAIFNGGVCYPADLLPSSVATYQCDPGFCLDVPSMEQGRCVDSYNRTCQANQMFSLQTATCIPMPTCPNTELIFSQISIEQRSAVYRCTSGFGISNPLLTYTAGVGWGEPPCCSDLSVGVIVGIILACVSIPQILVGILVLLVVSVLWYSRGGWSTGTKIGLVAGVLLLVPLIGILLVGAPITVWLCLQCCGKRYTVEFKKNEETQGLQLEQDDQPRYQDPNAIHRPTVPLSREVVYAAVAERDRKRISHPLPPLEEHLVARTPTPDRMIRKSRTLPPMMRRAVSTPDGYGPTYAF